MRFITKNWITFWKVFFNANKEKEKKNKKNFACHLKIILVLEGKYEVECFVHIFDNCIQTTLQFFQ